MPARTTSRGPRRALDARLGATSRLLTNCEPPQRKELLVVGTLLVVAAAALLGAHVANGNFYSDDWALGAIFDQYGGASHPFHVIREFLHLAKGRPTLALYVPATFAVFGTDPHLHLAWLAFLAAIVSMLLYIVLRTVGLSTIASLIISIVVLAFPASDSLKFWVAGSQPQFAIALYLLGTIIAFRAFQAIGRRSLLLHAGSVALYILSITAYEATFGLIFFSVGLYTLKARTRAVWIRSAVDMAVVVVVLLGVSARTSKQIHGIEDQLHHAKIIFQQALDLFSKILVPWGPAPSRTLLVLLILAVLGAGAAVLLMSSGQPAWRRQLKVGVLLTAGGVASVAAAYLPYVPADDYYSPYGAETLNRVNASATIGYAVLAFGLVLTVGVLLFRATPATPVFVLVVSVVIVTGCVRQFVADEHLWDRAATNERQVLSLVSRVVPSPKPGTTIYLWGSRTSLTSQLPVFSATWDLTGAMQLRYHDYTVNAFPILPATGFVCGSARMYPTNGLYDPSMGADYAHGVFVDFVSGRATAIKGRAACRRAVRMLSTPSLAFVSLPSLAQQGMVIRVQARLTRGIDPVIAAPVQLRLGSGADAQTCAATTLPNGLAVCEFGIPTTMIGAEPVSASFAGDTVLRSATAPASSIMVDPAG